MDINSILWALVKLLTPEADRLMQEGLSPTLPDAMLQALGRDMARRRDLAKLEADERLIYQAMLAVQKENGGKPVRLKRVSDWLDDNDQELWIDDSTRWRKVKMLKERGLVIHIAAGSPYWQAVELPEEDANADLRDESTAA